MKPIEKVEDYSLGEKIRYHYRGFGPSWIGSLFGEVVKINKKTVKVKLYRPTTNEFLTYNVNPQELSRQ